MATYVNDLRLKEITTGDEAGTWGNSTNTNLELIAEAFSYGTQASFSSDANATTTIADGSTDPVRSLYLKDDDFRLSFLYGSYLTLTNLQESDWKRIEDQRLSPLFVSVHATNPELRALLLKNPRAGLIMKQIEWFAKRKLQIHAQVVVCPGINDGIHLEHTLKDLAKYASGAV